MRKESKRIHVQYQNIVYIGKPVSKTLFQWMKGLRETDRGYILRFKTYGETETWYAN